MTMTNQATMHIASGDELDVRWFSVQQAMSRLFRVEVRAMSRNLDIDFGQVIGREASFTLGTVLSQQAWRGVCVDIHQVKVERDMLATYTLTLAPRAVLLTQRKNYRVFQYESEIGIVSRLLSEWGVPHRVKVDGAVHKPRKFRVQYGETDFSFACRLLEDAGISFHFEDDDGETTMVLDDEPQQADLVYPALKFHDSPGVAVGSFVTKVAVGRRVRPGKTTIGDLDYRRPSSQQPRLSASAGLAQESRLEQFDHEPGAFLYQRVEGGGGSTPTADDRGVTRTDEAAGDRKTKNRLLGRRQDAQTVRLESNVLRLSPGTVFSVGDHPHAALGPGATLLTRGAVIEGAYNDIWRVRVEAVFTDTPFRPAPVTPKPFVHGMESATVVGGSADEIHTDEYARVRVHFHWDRESKRDQDSSCWLPTSQPWAGAGFGGVTVPRVGQEVLVQFLNGDPDRPVVIGRVFTEHQPPPYPMPQGKMLTGIIGLSSPQVVSGAWDDTGMSRSDMGDQLGTYGGVGQDGVFHARPPEPFSPYVGENAFLIGDSQGQDITFIQARRDLNFLVKNNWTSVVGNYRATRIGGDDLLHIKNKQQIDVKNEQALEVLRDQTIEVGELREEKVKGDLSLRSLGDLIVNCDGTIVYKAKQPIVLHSHQVLRFEVGSSSISVNQTTIIVDAPSVHINPRT